MGQALLTELRISLCHNSAHLHQLAIAFLLNNKGFQKLMQMNSLKDSGEE